MTDAAPPRLDPVGVLRPELGAIDHLVTRARHVGERLAA